jgi:carboxyl-terminal processing protease
MTNCLRLTLKAYIDRLDSPKRFFLASDIKEFKKWQYKLDDLAKRGDLSAGFISIIDFVSELTSDLLIILRFLKTNSTNLILRSMKRFY